MERQAPPHLRVTSDLVTERWEKQIWLLKDYIQLLPEVDAGNLLDATRLEVDGSNLMFTAKKSVGKAAGAHSWKPEDLLLLPIAWWDKLAALWNRVVVGKSLVPTRWSEIRMFFIPKATGGFRPLGIASVVWRICAKTLVHRLTPWLDKWPDAWL